MKSDYRFKKGMVVVKLPLEDAEHATVIKVARSDKQFAYCSDGNKYAQSNGRCSGRCVLGKKDIILLPPFGYSAEEEAERRRNVAIRQREAEEDQLKYEQEKAKDLAKEQAVGNLAVFQQFKDVWKKAKRVKTPLGDIRIVSITLSGTYCGESAINVFMLLLNKKQEHGKTVFTASGANILELTSNLYDAPITRLFTIHVCGATKNEAIGAFFSTVTSFEK